MCIALERKNKNLYNWLINLGNHKHFQVLMTVLFFAEAIFFPIPIDPLLILGCLKQQSKCFYLASIATIASVLGGITAYGIGYLLWDNLGSKIINNFAAPDSFATVCHQLELYESWAVLIAGFTPFPYKAVALITGFCRAPIWPFIIFSLISRGSRFMLVAFLAKRFGTKVQYYVDRYGVLLLIIFMLVSVVSYYLFGLKLG